MSRFWFAVALLVASGCSDSTPPASGEPPAKDAEPAKAEPLRRPAGPIGAVAMSPSHCLAAVGGADGRISLWLDGDRSAFADLETPGAAVKGLAFSPDGRRLAATFESSGRVVIYNVDKRTAAAHLDGNAGAADLAWSGDGSLLAVHVADNIVRVWDPAASKAVCDLKHDAPVRAMAMSPDGEFVATVEGDSSLVVWGNLHTHADWVAVKILRNGIACGFGPTGTMLFGIEARGREIVWGTGDFQQRSSRAIRGVGLFPPVEKSVRPALSANAAYLFYRTPLHALVCVRLDSGAVAVDPEGGRATAVALTPDGTAGITGHADGSVRFWDTTSMTETFWVPPAGLGARKVDPKPRLSPDPKPQPAKRDFAGIENRPPVPSPPGRVAWSPDGKRIAATTVDGKSWRILDAADGKEVYREPLTGERMIDGLEFHPDSQQVAVMRTGAPTEVVDYTKRRVTHQSQKWGQGRPMARFAPDGKTLLISHIQDRKIGYVLVEDLVEMTEARVVWSTGPIIDIDFAADGKPVAINTNGRRGELAQDRHNFDDTSRLPDELAWAIGGNIEDVDAFVRTPDGSMRAVVVGDTVTLYASASKRVLGRVSRDLRIGGAALSPDGRTVATVTIEGALRLHAVPEVSRRIELPLDEPVLVSTALLGRDGLMLAAATDGRLLLFEPGKPARAWGPASKPGERVWAVAASADGSRIAVAGTGDVRLFDRAGALTRTLPTDALWVESVVFAPDGKRLAGADADGALVMWDAETGKPVRTLRPAGVTLSAPAFSPDGKRLAACDADGFIHVIDLDGGADAKFDTGKPRRLLAFAPDGNSVAAADDRKLVVWSLTENRRVATADLASAPRRIGSVGDGRWVVVGAGRCADVFDPKLDARVSLNIETGDPLAAAISADGELFVVGRGSPLPSSPLFIRGSAERLRLKPLDR